MNYTSIVNLHRNHKSITFFLSYGEHLAWENIVDVEIHEIEEVKSEINKNEICKYEN